jgi:hypothetical protein
MGDFQKIPTIIKKINEADKGFKKESTNLKQERLI